jgi:precorrin-6x reductase
MDNDNDNGTSVVIFGGTTEGRLLAECCSSRGIETLYCAATELGALVLPGVRTRSGRLDIGGMTELLRALKPAITFDATHPYAAEASGNIKVAADTAGVKLLRVLREKSDTGGAKSFTNEEDLTSWLSETPGVIFAATGLKEARHFTRIPGFAERVVFRLLPGVEGLKTCLDLGYAAKNLILMYGPFSKELNRALFSSVNAKILVTKDSGGAGGYREKAEAALELGMKIALLERPPENGPAVSLSEAIEILSSEFAARALVY